MQSELKRRIDVIERGYEYLLAYAAQGRPDDAGTDVRATLEAMSDALAGLDQALVAAVAVEAISRRHDTSAFLVAVDEDARRARGAIAFVLNCAEISSLLVDNLNASVHLRALLTDLFLIDQGMCRC